MRLVAGTLIDGIVRCISERPSLSFLYLSFRAFRGPAERSVELFHPRDPDLSVSGLGVGVTAVLELRTTQDYFLIIRIRNFCRNLEFKVWRTGGRRCLYVWENKCLKT